MPSLVRAVAILATALSYLPGTIRAATTPQIVINELDANWDHQNLDRYFEYNFDIDWRDGSNPLVITETVDRSKFSTVTGDLDFIKGNPLQSSDVVVSVRMVSSSVDALDQLYVGTRGPQLIIGSELGSTGGDAAVYLKVVVYIKPHCLQMGLEGTTVDTANLNINIWPGLIFETYRMEITTDHGNITGSELNTFTAHEITVRAKHGHIFGEWSLPSAIRLITHVGNIDVDLIPKRWSSGPNTRGDLHAEANRGDVTIRMPFDRDKLSLRNGSTVIQSVAGVISGTLVHSAYTRILSQWYGTINVTLLPYWSFYEWQGIQYNYLRTDAFGNHTGIHILPPVIDNYEPVNPLCLMKSYHKTIYGRMDISYPREWCGRANADSYNIPRSPNLGRVAITGEDFEVLYDEPQHAMVQRRPLGSQLNLDVVGGFGHLELR